MGKMFKALRLHGGVTAWRLEAAMLKGIHDQQKKIISFLPLKLEYTEQGSQERHLWRIQFEMHFELGLIKAQS